MRFNQRLDLLRQKYGEDACWPWPGARTKGGYGVTFHPIKKGKTTAHRRAYAELFGWPPDNVVVDHKICQNPPCVNPAHLEAVTHYVNVVTRSRRKGAVAHRAGTCTKGHPKRAGKPCKVCFNTWMRAYRKRRSAWFRDFERERSKRRRRENGDAIRAYERARYKAKHTSTHKS